MNAKSLQDQNKTPTIVATKGHVLSLFSSYSRPNRACNKITVIDLKQFITSRDM